MAGDETEPFVARVVDIVCRNGLAVVHLHSLGQPDEFIAALRDANIVPRERPEATP